MLAALLTAQTQEQIDAFLFDCPDASQYGVKLSRESSTLTADEVELLLGLVDSAWDDARELRGAIVIDNDDNEEHPDVVEHDQHVVALEVLLTKLREAKE